MMGRKELIKTHGTSKTHPRQTLNKKIEKREWVYQGKQATQAWNYYEKQHRLGWTGAADGGAVAVGRGGGG